MSRTIEETRSRLASPLGLVLALSLLVAAPLAAQPSAAVLEAQLDRRQQFLELFGSGYRHALAGNHDTADTLLTEAIELGVPDARPYYVRGLNHYFAGAMDAAKIDFAAGALVEEHLDQRVAVARLLEGIQGPTRKMIEAFRTGAEVVVVDTATIPALANAPAPPRRMTLPEPSAPAPAPPTKVVPPTKVAPPTKSPAPMPTPTARPEPAPTPKPTPAPAAEAPAAPALTFDPSLDPQLLDSAALAVQFRPRVVLGSGLVATLVPDPRGQLMRGLAQAEGPGIDGKPVAATAMLDELDIDPAEDIESVTLLLGDLPTTPPVDPTNAAAALQDSDGLLVLRGVFDPARVRVLMDRGVEAGTLEAATIGGVQAWRTTDPENAAIVTQLSPQVLLVSSKPEIIAEALAKAAGTRQPQLDAQLRPLLESFEPTAAISLAAVVPEEAKEAAAPAGQAPGPLGGANALLEKLTGIRMAVTLTDDLGVQIVGNFTQPSAAQMVPAMGFGLLGMVQQSVAQQDPAMGEILAGIQMKADGTTATISTTLTAEQVGKLGAFVAANAMQAGLPGAPGAPGGPAAPPAGNPGFFDEPPAQPGRQPGNAPPPEKNAPPSKGFFDDF